MFAPCSKAKTIPSGVEAYPTPPGVCTSSGTACIWFVELLEVVLGDMLTDKFAELTLFGTISGKEDVKDVDELLVTGLKLFIITFREDKMFEICDIVFVLESLLQVLSESGFELVDLVEFVS